MLKLYAVRDTEIRFQMKKKRNAIGWTTKKTKIIPQISNFFCSRRTSDKTQIKGKWKMYNGGENKIKKTKKRIAKTSQKQ